MLSSQLLSYLCFILIIRCYCNKDEHLNLTLSELTRLCAYVDIIDRQRHVITDEMHQMD